MDHLAIIISMIESTSIESLRNSIDIVDVIGSYIELKKTGANFKANCPFHGEKTPSFVVSPSKQIYHCFGCGAGGDSIKFVMEIEKLSYPEAVEKLASMHNFTLQYTQGASEYDGAKRILEAIKQWYVKNLDYNEAARQYLRSRGVSGSSIEAFEIGYAGSSQSVISFLQNQHLPLPQAQEAGIIARGEKNELYARLVERIIFPIHSPNGSIAGFGGRTMGNHPAKYINSPQTKLFNKSRLLYGYHKAKERIYANKRVIVCEGYLDVIMLHQAGFGEAVATLGTALTAEHLPLLRRGEPRIILAYDGDKAGVAAALKAAQMLSVAGFDGGVVLFPGGQDPADMIAQDKSEEVSRLLRTAAPLIPFVIETIASSHTLANPREKEVAFGAIKHYLASLSPIMQDAYTQTAATHLGISASLFSRGVIHQKAKERIVQKKEDIALLGIIKTLLERPTLIDDVLDVLDSSMFGEYEPLLLALLQSGQNHLQLDGLMIDETICSLSEEELKQSLLWILSGYYTQQYQSIAKNTNLSYEKKSHYMRKIKTDIIPRLKKGELVAYESFGII